MRTLAGGDRSTLLGVFWMGVGFAIAALSEVLPDPDARRTTIWLALAFIVLGGIFVYLIPPFLTLRWCRAQRAGRR
ncbi:hypothetical protein [Amnibacterium setariae]|uniref:Uncharacterized protein n=1 Tax=Amnibacterium setariae TaxID=2306585 RepID=A0A3A1U4G6_9MICO|nr:hypothetical protein [Amnibacterium setariae]RIX27864.1 hypothetical protein D1781_10040 [Amnibacterium setariae]